MSSGELGGGLGDGVRAPAAEPAMAAGRAGLAVPEILNLTDRILNEPGRRSHLFTWLRRPGGGPADRLPVDAYYPGSKVVVVCRETAGPYRELFADVVPAHGLRLLEVDERELLVERDAARRTLERSIAELRSLGRQAAGASARGKSSTTPNRRRPAPHPPAAGDPQRQQVARERPVTRVLTGLTLAVVLVVEVYIGVIRAGFDSGHVLLGFGLALDACSRGLGTIAASRYGSSEWAWWCALGGSPVVAWFALFRRDGPVRTEPAPLAGLIGVLALLVLAVALLATAL